MSRTAEFAALHVPGDPLVLFNAWDAGTARAVRAAGAPAIATGSWSVAAAHGFDDGELLPWEFARDNAARICAAVDVPVTVDVERGYGPDEIAAAHMAELAAFGVAGINIEDGTAEGPLVTVEEMSAKLRAVKAAAGQFVNARYDRFLTNPADRHADLLDDALTRGRAYAEAGADGYFVPGLADPSLIEQVVAGVALPVNIMVTDSTPSRDELARLGVARISYGPVPYLRAMAWLEEQARGAFGTA